MNITEKTPLNIVSEDAIVSMPPSLTKAPNHSSSKKLRRFTIGMCVYAVCLLLLVGGGLWFVSNGLAQYEAATPSKALEQHLTLIQTKNFEALYESSGFQETLLNTKADYIDYLERLYIGTPHTITAQELLSSDPSVQQYAVCFDGKPVSTISTVLENGVWLVRTQLTYQPSYTLYAAPEITVTVNGNDLALLGTPHTQAQQSLFERIDGEDPYPTVVCYMLEGLLNPPRCMAYTLDGTPCTVVSFETDPRTLYVSNQTVTDSLKTLAESVISDYACFIAGDVKRQTMFNYVYKNSTAYEQIATYNNRNFRRHTSYDLGEIEITDPLSFTDFDYSCTATLCPTYSYNGETFGGDPLACRLTFIKIEDEWLLTSLVNTTPSSSDNIDTTTQTEESL